MSEKLGNGAERVAAHPVANQGGRGVGDHLRAFVFDEVRPVRVVHRKGEPWFVAKDVCAALGIKNSRDAISVLDADEVGGVGLTYTPSNQHGTFDPVQQEVTVISESGLYTLILRSRQATTPGTVAHRFRRWVTGEVLPQLRRAGAYSIKQRQVEAQYLRSLSAAIGAIHRAGDKATAEAVARHYAAELGIVAASAHTAASDGGPVVTLQGRVRPLVMAFLAERTRPVARGLVGATDLYNAFLAWLEDHGEPAVTHRAAGDAFRLSGLKKGRGRVVVYLGIELVAKAPSPPSGMAE